MRLNPATIAETPDADPRGGETDSTSYCVVCGPDPDATLHDLDGFEHAAVCADCINYLLT